MSARGNPLYEVMIDESIGCYIICALALHERAELKFRMQSISGLSDPSPYIQLECCIHNDVKKARMMSEFSLCAQPPSLDSSSLPFNVQGVPYRSVRCHCYLLDRCRSGVGRIFEDQMFCKRRDVVGLDKGRMDGDEPKLTPSPPPQNQPNQDSGNLIQ